MRRRPLMRAAMVGGAGYAVGKSRANKAQHEAEQDAALSQAQQGQAPPAAAPAEAPLSDVERIDALTKLKDLLDSGVLTQEQFEAEKQKLLPG